MLKPMKINEELVDLEKVSFVSAIDKIIKHDIKKASVTYFFNLVTDGHLVMIQNDNLELLTAQRNTLCLSLAPELE